MGRAKDIELKVIPSKIANAFIKKHHYSGKVVNNSNLHFGAFLDGRLHGVLSYGSSLDKSKMLGLVKGTNPEIPFYKIDELGAGMYKGEKITVKERHIDEYCINNEN